MLCFYFINYYSINMIKSNSTALFVLTFLTTFENFKFSVLTADFKWFYGGQPWCGTVTVSDNRSGRFPEPAESVAASCSRGAATRSAAECAAAHTGPTCACHRAGDVRQAALGPCSQLPESALLRATTATIDPSGCVLNLFYNRLTCYFFNRLTCYFFFSTILKSFLIVILDF